MQINEETMQPGNEKQLIDIGGIKIECVNCREDFFFSRGEQEFFKKMGFVFPKRCKACRIEKKCFNKKQKGYQRDRKSQDYREGEGYSTNRE